LARSGLHRQWRNLLLHSLINQAASKLHFPPQHRPLHAFLPRHMFRLHLTLPDLAALQQHIQGGIHLLLPPHRLRCNVLHHLLHNATGVAAQPSLPAAVAAPCHCRRLLLLVLAQANQKAINSLLMLLLLLLLLCCAWCRPSRQLADLELALLLSTFNRPPPLHVAGRVLLVLLLEVLLLEVLPLLWWWWWYCWML
jgi:hypothetical protein